MGKGKISVIEKILFDLHQIDCKPETDSSRSNGKTNTFPSEKRNHMIGNNWLKGQETRRNRGKPGTCWINASWNAGCKSPNKERKRRISTSWGLEMKKLGRFDEGLTRVIRSSHGSSCKIAAPISLAFPLEIAVHSIIAVILHSVGLVTSPILKNCRAVSTSSAGIIQGLLKGLVTHPIFTHTIQSSTYPPRKTDRISPQKLQKTWGFAPWEFPSHGGKIEFLENIGKKMVIRHLLKWPVMARKSTKYTKTAMIGARWWGKSNSSLKD